MMFGEEELGPIGPENQVTNAAPGTPSWRDRVKVHPAADLFPMMSDDELKVLGENIKAHGLQQPIVLLQPKAGGDPSVLDGRNRIAGAELVGLPIFGAGGQLLLNHEIIEEPAGFDPYTYAENANLHRRHLSIEDREKAAARIAKARPDLSNREIARITKVSHPKVAKIRGKLEAAGDVEIVSTRTDTAGRAQPAHKATPKPKPSIEIDGKPVDPNAPLVDAELRTSCGLKIGDAKLPATLFAPPDPEPPAAPAEPLAETSELTDGGWIEPHIEAAVQEYRKLPPRHRRNAMHVMDVIDLKDHRKIRKDAIRLWAIEHEKVGWLLDHFGIEVKWPNFDAWVGGCGDNNTRVRVDGDPVITAAAARRDKRVRLALAYIASLDLGLDDLTASPGADVEAEGAAPDARS
jgi:hypothetical protein